MTKEQLVNELNTSRIDIAQGIDHLQASLNVPRRIKRNLHDHLAYWMGGAGLFGFILALVGRKPRSLKTKKSPQIPSAKEPIHAPIPAKARAKWMVLGLAIFKALLPILRPLVTDYIHQTAQKVIQRRS